MIDTTGWDPIGAFIAVVAAALVIAIVVVASALAWKLWAAARAFGNDRFARRNGFARWTSAGWRPPASTSTAARDEELLRRWRGRIRW